jgi:CRP-like cAMP-binding protein
MKLDAAAFVADHELVEALKRYSSPVVCDQDRVLFKQGGSPSGLYIFHKGSVRLEMQSQLGDTLMNIAAIEDSLLGLPGLISGTPYSLSAYAQKGAELGFVSRDEFARIMLSAPAIAVGILRVLAAEVRTARMALMEG